MDGGISAYRVAEVQPGGDAPARFPAMTDAPAGAEILEGRAPRNDLAYRVRRCALACLTNLVAYVMLNYLSTRWRKR